ncbi:glycoside hydrolase family 78 protein [soil metagenome]
MPAVARLADLRVETLTEPIALATAVPRFSWMLEAEAGAQGATQTAYELEVTGPAGLVMSSRGGAESFNVRPEGAPLASRTAYEWRVRVWVGDDTEPTPWASSRFETSLLDTAAWSALWVRPVQEATELERYSLAGALAGLEGPGTPPAQRLRPPQRLRQVFTVVRLPRRARLYISARGLYEAELNGAVVGDEVLAPGYDSYADRISFQGYDVTDSLTVGDNALGVTIADGWFAGRIGLTGSSANYGDRVEAIWQLELGYDDGAIETVVSGADVRATAGPWEYADLFIGERYDTRLAQPGWSTAVFDDSSWRPVEVREVPTTLVPFPGEPVRRILELPGTVLTTPNGETVVDLGQVIAGRVRISFDLPAGTEVKLEHSEVLNAHGDFFSNIMGPNKDQTDYVIAAGGAQSWEPTFTFHGFRYVRVTGVPALQDGDVTGVVISSDLRTSGSFRTSDARINRLHENVQWSQRGNFLSIPTDCPQRERAGWTGDLQVFIPAATTNQHVLGFVERWLANARADQLDDGQIPMVVPDIPSLADGGLGMGASSAAWGDAIVIVPHVLYRRYGDSTVLRDNYDAMVRWVEYQIEVAERDLPDRLDAASLSAADRARQALLWNTGFHFGDWLAPSTLTEAPMPDSAMIAPMRTGELVASMFHANSLTLLAEIAGVLGHDEDQQRYSQRAAAVRQAFTEEYVAADGTIAANLQGPYVNALAFDMVPPQMRPLLVGKLVELVHAAGDHLDTGFVSVPYLLDVLWESGERDLARTLLSQDTVPSWLYEVDRGATTIWESWAAILPDGTVSPMSMNHYAFGCVDDWMFRRIAGIQELEPGFRVSRIEPDLESPLDWVEASHETPYGTLAVSWRRGDGGVEVTVDVPPSSSAEIVLGAITELVGPGRFTRVVTSTPAG